MNFIEIPVLELYSFGNSDKIYLAFIHKDSVYKKEVLESVNRYLNDTNNLIDGYSKVIDLILEHLIFIHLHQGETLKVLEYSFFRKTVNSCEYFKFFLELFLYYLESEVDIEVIIRNNVKAYFLEYKRRKSEELKLTEADKRNTDFVDFSSDADAKAERLLLESSFDAWEEDWTLTQGLVVKQFTELKCEKGDYKWEKFYLLNQTEFPLIKGGDFYLRVRNIINCMTGLAGLPDSTINNLWKTYKSSYDYLEFLEFIIYILSFGE